LFEAAVIGSRNHVCNRTGISMSQDKTDLPGNEPNPAATETPDATEAQVQATDTSADIVDDELAVDDADDVETLRAALVEKTEEVEKYRDQALRAAAETENVRKRAQRD